MTIIGGGVNLKSNDKLPTYLKNCCVASLSAKQHTDADTDVLVVTNLEMPQPYAEILSQGGVKLLQCDFDSFAFGKDYLWSLAFYKLCALEHIVKEHAEYDCVAYMDIDVFIQSSFEPIWRECQQNICLYDFCHGLNDNNYLGFLEEVTTFKGASGIGLTHFGGEFFAATREQATVFVNACKEIFKQMEEKNFQTKYGDEFITSMAADSMRPSIRNVGAYVCRYWTRRYRFVSDNYKHHIIVVLHVPAEKEDGMLRLYKYYLRHGRMPKEKTVWKMLHLPHAALPIRMYHWLKGK